MCIFLTFTKLLTPRQPMKSAHLILSFLLLAPIAWSQAVEDAFDSYNSGGLVGVESEGLWTTWYNNPGSSEDAMISNDRALSLPNSLKIETNGSDTIDVVLPLGNIASGIWELSFWMHIEQGHGAYFNILHAFEPSASNWAAQFWFSKIGFGHMTVGSGSLNHNFTHPRGRWFEVLISVNIETDLALLTLDGEEVVHWTWSDGSMNQTPTKNSNFGALCFVSAAEDGSDPLFHIDDVSFHSEEVGLEDLNAQMRIYPNPSNDFFYLENIPGTSVKVYDLLGNRYFTEQTEHTNTLVDGSAWKKGVYLLKVSQKKQGSKVRKLILK